MKTKAEKCDRCENLAKYNYCELCEGSILRCDECWEKERICTWCQGTR